MPLLAAKQGCAVHAGSIAHPAGALAVMDGLDDSFVTYEVLDCSNEASTSGLVLQQQQQQQQQQGYNPSPAWLGPRLYTSSNTRLSQCFAYMDAFQAFDRRTRVSSAHVRHARGAQAALMHPKCSDLALAIPFQHAKRSKVTHPKCSVLALVHPFQHARYSMACRMEK